MYMQIYNGPTTVSIQQCLWHMWRGSIDGMQALFP